MLAPQFTLRRLLAWVTLCAFVCLILAAAARGRLWAAGIVVALAGGLIMMGLFAATFGVVKLLGTARDARLRNKTIRNRIKQA
jgi:hypothetical protein